MDAACSGTYDDIIHWWLWSPTSCTPLQPLLKEAQLCLHEVPISTVVTQRTPKVILYVLPPATVQSDAQQLFDGSDKDLAALDTSAELALYCVQSFESLTVIPQMSVHHSVFFILSHELRQTLAIRKVGGTRKTTNTLCQGTRRRGEGPQK